MPITVIILFWLQCEVEEGDFNYAPSGYCDIPGTSAVRKEVFWKIGTYKESTMSSQKRSR